MNTISKSRKLFFLSLFVIAVSGMCLFGFTANSTINKDKGQILQDKDKPGENEIFMDNLKFIPRIKTIKPGTKITWINKETAMHTVVSGVPGKKSGLFESKTLGEGGKFSFTFKKPGIYKYYCGTHEDIMTAIIIVKE